MSSRLAPRQSRFSNARALLTQAVPTDSTLTVAVPVAYLTGDATRAIEMEATTVDVGLPEVLDAIVMGRWRAWELSTILLKTIQPSLLGRAGRAILRRPAKPVVEGGLCVLAHPGSDAAHITEVARAYNRCPVTAGGGPYGLIQDGRPAGA